MQSTGQGGRHNSHPVHSDSIMVCELLCANDGIDRAGGDAKRASDALGFIDTRNLFRRCGWNLGR